MWHDQKCYYPQRRSALMTSINRLFLLTNFITEAPLWQEIKSFVMWLWSNDITTSWGRVLNGILWMRLPAVQIYVSIPPMIRYIWIFKLVILLTLRSPKLMVILITLDKSKLTLVVYFYCFEQVTVILLNLSKTLSHEKQSKSSQFDKKFKNHT